MTGRQLRRARRILEDLRADLGWVLQEKLAGLASSDPVDLLRRPGERDLDSRDVDFLVVRVSNVEAALRSIDEGTFGRCYFCEDDIDPELLESAPWSRCCAACEEDLVFLTQVHIRLDPYQQKNDGSATHPA